MFFPILLVSNTVFLNSYAAPSGNTTEPEPVNASNTTGLSDIGNTTGSTFIGNSAGTSTAECPAGFPLMNEHAELVRCNCPPGGSCPASYFCKTDVYGEPGICCSDTGNSIINPYCKM